MPFSLLVLGRMGVLSAVVILGISACGGGGDSSDGLIRNLNTGNPEALTQWELGVFPEKNRLVARCELPRSGTDNNNVRFRDTPGTALDEKMWLRSWSNDLYLWYDEIVDLNPERFSVSDYFDVLKTTEETRPNRPKDRFHFTENTAEYTRFTQSGIRVGYGARFAISNQSPRTIRVILVEDGSPADGVLQRGTYILSVDGVDVTEGTTEAINTLNAGLFPRNNDVHAFVVRDVGATETRQISLRPRSVASNPVHTAHVIDAGSSKVGYMLFNNHIKTAELALEQAIADFSEQAIDELVLDLRYNGGGLLNIASQLAYMIAGPAATSDRIFERLSFNDKHPTTNPVTRQPIVPIEFIRTALVSPPEGRILPTLNLSRLFVITSSSTCSASESIINGLDGIDMEVVLIGTNTCGKPFGFYPQDNCGTTYFSVQFQGNNEKGFGSYPDGFGSIQAPVAPSVRLPGCHVEGDDLEHLIGDQEENKLAVALNYIQRGSCTLPVNTSKSRSKLSSDETVEYQMLGVPDWQKSRIINGP